MKRPVIGITASHDTEHDKLFINSVYLVATAAFLGFDPLGTGSDWGTMIQTGVTGISLNPWAALAPTIAIACITISGNLLLDRIGKRSNL